MAMKLTWPTKDRGARPLKDSLGHLADFPPDDTNVCELAVTERLENICRIVQKFSLLLRYRKLTSGR